MGAITLRGQEISLASLDADEICARHLCDAGISDLHGMGTTNFESATARSYHWTPG